MRIKKSGMKFPDTKKNPKKELIKISPSHIKHVQNKLEVT
jgi:hypothetical protein